MSNSQKMKTVETVEVIAIREHTRGVLVSKASFSDWEKALAATKKLIEDKPKSLISVYLNVVGASVFESEEDFFKGEKDA